MTLLIEYRKHSKICLFVLYYSYIYRYLYSVLFIVAYSLFEAYVFVHYRLNFTAAITPGDGKAVSSGDQDRQVTVTATRYCGDN